MKLVTGGAYQNKTEFAKKQFGLNDNDVISGRNETDTEILSGCRAVRDYEYVVRYNIENGRDAGLEYDRLISANPDIILIASEVGCGIIPIDDLECTFREEAGRILCRAASAADEVYRVICGIGKKIK